MAGKMEQKNVRKDRLLRDGVHTESGIVCPEHDDMLSEEEQLILSALRDPEKGPLLYKIMEDCLHG